MNVKCAICGDPGRKRIDPVGLRFMDVCEPYLQAMRESYVRQRIDWTDARQAKRLVLEASRRIRRETAARQEAAT